MILPKDSEAYEKLLKERDGLEPLRPFIEGYKDLFVSRFLEEIRKEIGSSKIRERFLKENIEEFYDSLFDFQTPAVKSVADRFLQIKNRGVAPLLLLQKLLSSFILRLVSDYSDDRELFGYIKLFSAYFDDVLEYMKSLLQKDTERDFATRVALREDELDKWLADGKSIRLLNVYKGIPVVYDATARRSSKGSVVLQMPYEKGLLAEREGRVVCFDRRMEPFAIEMKIERVVYEKRIALIEVDSPAWIDSIAQRRKRVRVALGTPLKGRINALGRQFDVDVIDLSGKGVCLQTDVGYGLPLYEQVEVTLPIPQDDGSIRNIVMRGTLQYISKLGDTKRRYHIFLHANPKKEEILSAFVARRELSLMKEIKSIAGRRKGDK